MKVLHVWDQAGVAAILAKYQKQLGHEAEVIKREGFDKYGIDKFYGTTIYQGSSIGFYCYALKRSKEFDLVHIHSQVKVVPFLRKPTVLHFHGSDLRETGKWGKLLSYFARKFVDKILVSTPDLLSVLPNAEWLHTPVDTDHFNSSVEIRLIHGVLIGYKDMPNYLRCKEFHVQTKPWALSKLSLETLACGIPVKWNGLTINSELPERHNPEKVAQRTIEIYEGILK